MVPDELRWSFRPEVRRPILIAAFEGWNDAGEAATTAINHLADEWSANGFAEIDPEEFFDFTSTRPQVQLDDEGNRELVWPSNDFYVAHLEASGRDVILLVGNEPQLRWRSFCAHVVSVAKALEVEMVVSLGALLADVPHTRPVRITGSADSTVVAARLGMARSRYEGPTGIVGVLHDALRAAGIESCSLWAAVPHYLPGTASPKAALALVDRVVGLFGLPVTTLDLQIATSEYERQVDEIVQGDDDMAAYVRRLEEGHDEGDDDDDEDLLEDLVDAIDDIDPHEAFTDAEGNLPTGDALAAEVEQFLRDQGA